MPLTARGRRLLLPVSRDALFLDWATSPEADVAHYNVYRSDTLGGPYTKINTQPVTTSSYYDATVALNTWYYYVVTAVDTADLESAYSAEQAEYTGSLGVAAVRIVGMVSISGEK